MGHRRQRGQSMLARNENVAGPRSRRSRRSPCPLPYRDPLVLRRRHLAQSVIRQGYLLDRCSHLPSVRSFCALPPVPRKVFFPLKVLWRKTALGETAYLGTQDARGDIPEIQGFPASAEEGGSQWCAFE